MIISRDSDGRVTLDGEGQVLTTGLSVQGDDFTICNFHLVGGGISFELTDAVTFDRRVENRVAEIIEERVKDRIKEIIKERVETRDFIVSLPSERFKLLDFEG